MGLLIQPGKRGATCVSGFECDGFVAGVES
jgi:hypothetical protein